MAMPAEPAIAQRRRRRVSPLTRSILAVNSLALALLVGGLLFLGPYQDRLIEAEIDALTTQGRIFAGSLAESAVAYGQSETDTLSPELARLMMHRLVDVTATRTRLFAADGALVLDSRDLAGTIGAIEVEPLPPPTDPWGQWLSFIYSRLVDWLPDRSGAPRYREASAQQAADYPEVMRGLTGEIATSAWSLGGRELLLAVAVPVQRVKQVLGVVYLTRSSAEMDAALRTVRLDIFRVFAISLTVTVLLSVYLAGTIARPMRRLAAAADRVRHGQGKSQEIPDFTARDDEIGDLSGALRDMTDALRARMMAIERFASDVAHEIKNPLSSLSSAVQTVTRVQDQGRRAMLFGIIQDDVRRLDRLITDISSYSRLDAELSRTELEPVDLAALLDGLVGLYRVTAEDGGNAGRVGVVGRFGEGSGPLVVAGAEDRLVQVFQNLLSNAVSFSPSGGTVTVSARIAEDGWIETSVIDQGPGIPDSKREAIFDRFYSERPADEKFGTHSGLGLSISRQIVEAHGGRIYAENQTAVDGGIEGAVFTVRLPSWSGSMSRQRSKFP